MCVRTIVLLFLLCYLRISTSTVISVFSLNQLVSFYEYIFMSFVYVLFLSTEHGLFEAV